MWMQCFSPPSPVYIAALRVVALETLILFSQHAGSPRPVTLSKVVWSYSAPFTQQHSLNTISEAFRDTGIHILLAQKSKISLKNHTASVKNK